MKKREYNRCRMACSMPPTYWSTGSQWSMAARSSGTSALAQAKRAKYHDESTKVSKVSVSRAASVPQDGQATCFQVGWRSSGLPGWSNVTSSGRVTGRSASGTGTMPQDGQWITGIGQPQ